MKKLLVLSLLLVLVAGCNGGYLSRYLEEAIEATVAQCEQAASSTAYGGTLLVERPDFGFPNQILSPEELVVDEVYVSCWLPGGDAIVYVLTSEPYDFVIFDETHPRLRVDVLHRSHSWSSHLFLADMGVVPYPNGKWNPANVLLRVPSTYVVDVNPW